MYSNVNITYPILIKHKLILFSLMLSTNIKCFITAIKNYSTLIL